MASDLFCTCYKYNMQVENATVLLLLAEIQKVILLISEFFSLVCYFYVAN